MVFGVVLQKHVCAVENKNDHAKIDFKKILWRTMLFKIKLQNKNYLLEEVNHSLAFWAELQIFSRMTGDNQERGLSTCFSKTLTYFRELTQKY